MIFFTEKKVGLFVLCMMLIIAGGYSQTSTAKHNDYHAAVDALKKNPAKTIRIVDSLLVLNEMDNSPHYKGELQFLKAKAHSNLGDKELATNWVNKAISLFQESGHQQLETKANIFAGQVLSDLGKWNEAIGFFDAAYANAVTLNDTVLIVEACSKQSRYYNATGDLESCLKSAIKGYEYIKNIDGFDEQKTVVYSTFGVIYQKMSDYEKSIEYHEKGIELAEKNGNVEQLYKLNINISSSYSGINENDKAEFYLKKALDLATSTQDAPKIAIAEAYLGDFYLSQKKYKKAIPILQRSLDRSMKTQDNYEAAYTLGSIGIAEVGIGNRSIGMKHMMQADSMIAASDMEIYKEALYKQMAEACSEFGFYKEGLDFYKKHVDSKDKIRTEDGQNKILELKTQYETQEKEQRIEMLTSEKRADNLLIWLSSLLVLFLFFAVLALLNSRKLQEKRNAALEKAKLFAEKAAREKAEFLATMSHEIRTPMNGVIGMANILADNEPRPDQAKDIEILKFSADNLLNLIDDILDLAKFEAGKIVLEEKDFDLNDYCEKAFSLFKSSKKNSNVELKLDLDLKFLDRQLKGDKMRLNQVITNLTNNALKFTQKGSVTLKVTTTELLKDKVKLKFEVIDTGIGISKEKQKTIFEKFEQATTETTRLYGGTGLGLNISKEIIKLFGSELKLISEQGKGSNFFFELDFPLSEKETKKESPCASKKKDFRMDGIRILLAEDNKINQLVAKRILLNWGAELSIAQNGLEAVEFAKSQTFDLILMDIQMPEMDGYTATDEIRKLSGANGGIPILAMTATETFSLVANVKKHKMDGYISKPFDPATLAEVINSHLNSEVKHLM